MLSLLTFFVLSTDFKSLDNPRSSRSSLDIVAEDMPSFLSKSLINLNSVAVFRAINTAFIKQIYEKKVILITSTKHQADRNFRLLLNHGVRCGA